MVWFYILLVILGLILTAALARRKSMLVLLAIAGTLLAIFSIITGFSIGVYVAPLAAVVLGFATAGLRPNDDRPDPPRPLR